MALVLARRWKPPQAPSAAFEDREQALVVRRVQRDIAGGDGKPIARPHMEWPKR